MMPARPEDLEDVVIMAEAAVLNARHLVMGTTELLGWQLEREELGAPGSEQLRKIAHAHRDAELDLDWYEQRLADARVALGRARHSLN